MNTICIFRSEASQKCRLTKNKAIITPIQFSGERPGPAPEGHTIHRVARDHQRRNAGRLLAVSSPQGRFAAGAKKLDGTLLEHVEAHGKHLLYRWEGDRIVHVHLGLYGKFRNHRSPVPAPRGAVRWRVVGESHAFDLNGPTACELLPPEQATAITARLGADPLRTDADVERVWGRISRQPT